MIRGVQCHALVLCEASCCEALVGRGFARGLSNSIASYGPAGERSKRLRHGHQKPVNDLAVKVRWHIFG